MHIQPGNAPMMGDKESGRMTRSTIDVLIAHFRYFVSERRGSSTPNSRNANLDFGKKRLVDSGHGSICRHAV